MHWFDKAFHGPNGPGTWAKAVLVRYADDFVIMARYMTKEIVSWIETLLQERFGLTINKEKTKIVDLGKPKEELTFLGYAMKLVNSRRSEGRKFCLTTPSAKSVKKARERIREHTHPKNGYKPIKMVVNQLNLFLEGWGRYFRKGYPGAAFDKVNKYTDARIYNFLQRRSQKGYRKEQQQTWYQITRDLGVVQLRKKHYTVNA